MLCEVQRNEPNLLTFKNDPINQRWITKAQLMELTMAYIVAFMKVSNSLAVWSREKK